MGRKSLKMAQAAITITLFHVLKEAPRPTPIVSIGAAGNSLNLCPWIVEDKGSIARKGRCVLFGSHIAATAPVLVPDTPEANLKRLCCSIGPSLVRQRRIA